MISTGLDFAPGTTDDCKKLITGLFGPTEIFSAYRMARAQFGTGDLVLCVSEQDPSGFEAEPRAAYVKRARDLSRGVPLLMRRMAEDSAHKVMQLPAESDAVWLVVVRGPQTVPVMCVLYATPYEVAAAAN
jgi:hypothetical protein